MSLLFPNIGLSNLIAQAMRNVEGKTINFNDTIYTIWTKDGRFHRENEPAVISDLTRLWYRNGCPHNDTGPAVYSKARPGFPNPTILWAINGDDITSEVEQWLEEYKLLPADPTTWTNQHKIYFKLTFGRSDNEC